MLIAIDDPNLEYRNEYDLTIDVYYNGKPYTGVIKDEFETAEYKNGIMHGKCITLYADNQLQSEDQYV